MKKNLKILIHSNHAHLILNRPNSLNAIQKDTFPIIQFLFQKWNLDPSIHFIICSGEGRSFCSGGDLFQITNGVRYNIQDAIDFVSFEYKMDYFLYKIKKPYISLMKGHVMGGGGGLALPAKYRIAHPTTIFSMPECSIGFYVDVGVIYHLARIPHNIGTMIALTGYQLNAADCMFTGICTHFVKNFDWMINEFEKSEDIEGIIKRHSSLEYGESKLKENMGWIEKCFSQISLDEIIFEIKKESSSLAKQLYQKMIQSSPTSLKVTFMMIKKAKNLNIEKVIQMNFSTSKRLFLFPDFVEGVRAKLIDKDEPKWNPSKIEDVSDDWIEKIIMDRNELDLSF